MPSLLDASDLAVTGPPPDRVARVAVEGGRVVAYVYGEANEETILISDGTLFLVPAGMRLPHYPAGTTLVIEYEILKGRNVLAHVPEIEGEAS